LIYCRIQILSLRQWFAFKQWSQTAIADHRYSLQSVSSFVCSALGSNRTSRPAWGCLLEFAYRGKKTVAL